MDNISIFIKIQTRLLKGHIKYITYIKTYTCMSPFLAQCKCDTIQVIVSH